jgi:hypothetical protein
MDEKHVIFKCARCGKIPKLKETFDFWSNKSYWYSVQCCDSLVLTFRGFKRAVAGWNFRQLTLTAKMAQLTDSDLYQFILDLDSSDLELTNWEVTFVQSLIDGSISTYSEKQRDVLKRMVDKYDNLLKS